MAPRHKYLDGLRRGGMLGDESPLGFNLLQGPYMTSNLGQVKLIIVKVEGIPCQLLRSQYWCAPRLKRGHWLELPVAGVDLALLKRFYDAVIELETGEVKAAIMESIDKLLTELLIEIDPMQSNGAVDSTTVIRTIVALLENRLFMDPDYHTVLTKLWKLILGLPPTSKTDLFVALEKYGKEQFEQLISIVQAFITMHVYESRLENEPVILGMDILQELYSVNEKSQQVSVASFYNDAVNSEDFDLKEDFRRWRLPETKHQFSYCKYPFIYDPSSKSKILQLDANVQMRHEFQDAVLRSIFIGATCPYLVLRVNRENLMRETILQIQQQSDDLKKPLKVQFIGEEGVDEGGVQKEFFQLVIREVFDPKYGMFSYNEETRHFWFNSSPLDMDMEYELVGILLGLAIYNGHILELHFPSVIYKKLLNKAPKFEDLAEVDPLLAKGLEQLLSFTGDVEAVFVRSFQVSVEDIFGDIRTVALKEDGSSTPVTPQNRQEYVNLCVEYYMDLSIKRAFDAFKHGFQKLCKGPVVNRMLDGISSIFVRNTMYKATNSAQLFQPVELEQLICGSPELDFEALERATIYEDGYKRDSEVICNFWEVVHSLEEENKRKLLFFVTGCDRAPIKGLANLHFVISRNGTDSERLPTAHTCFNHLLLPEYDNKGKLKERLTTAINYAEGFGLM